MTRTWKYIVVVILICTLQGGVGSKLYAQLNTDRITAIGRNALYFNDYVLSIQYFNQVIKLKPYLAEPYLLRGIAKIQLSDYQGSLLDLNRAIERNPFHPGAYYTRGYIYRQLQDYEAAERDFTSALVHAPENHTYKLLRADVRAEMGHYNEALEDIGYLMRHEPKSASLHFEKGVIELAQKDTLSALTSFQQATNLEPYNSGNWSALGMLNLLIGNEDEAIEDLSKSIALGSKWAGDYVNRSILYHRRNNFRGALDDLDKAIQLSPKDGHIYFNRGILRQQVGDYNRAEDDLRRAGELNPEQYPAFILDAIIARKPIDERQMREQAANYQPPKRDRRKEFSSRTAQNIMTEPQDNYESETRGSIQQHYTDVVNEPNMALGYYAQTDPMRRTTYFYYAIEQYNRLRLLPSPLQLTCHELTLSADMIDVHFEQISRLSNQIDNFEGKYTFSQSSVNTQQGAALYLSRAIEFALVQDYVSANEDCTKAINMNPQLVFAHFMRANWRYKQVEYQRATGDIKNTTKFEMDFEIMLRDYDYVIAHMPDFAFAYYNKANILCQQKDYAAAIVYYTKAIDVDADFAEAYYNRGLTYIYTNNIPAGIADLSRAGELGIYKAYNLINRFQ